MAHRTGEVIRNIMLKRPLLRQTLGSGLAFGSGLMFGSVLQLLIAGYVSFAPGRDLDPDVNFLLIGVLLAFLISALTGGIGGFFGGWTLPVVDRPRGRWGYAWQGAISLAVPTGIFLFVTLLIISLLTFYSQPGDPPSQFALTFALTGVLYGLLIGLLLGILTVGWRRSGRVVLYALVGFGLGGIGFGLGLREFLMSVSNGDLSTGNIFFLLLGIAVLGFLGGSALGMIYNRLATEPTTSRKPFKLSPIALVIIVGMVILLIFSLSTLSPFLDRLSAVLTPRSAGLSTTLASDTAGTHWSDPVVVATIEEGLAQSALAATDEQVALVWRQDNGGSSAIVYRSGSWNADIQGTEWSPPITIDQSSGQSSEPQVTLDRDGVAHILWRDRDDVFYSRCQIDDCTEPTPLSEEAVSNCGGGANKYYRCIGTTASSGP